MRRRASWIEVKPHRSRCLGAKPVPDVQVLTGAPCGEPPGAPRVGDNVPLAACCCMLPLHRRMPRPHPIAPAVEGDPVGAARPGRPAQLQSLLGDHVDDSHA
jgi:hypothetical protein